MITLVDARADHSSRGYHGNLRWWRPAGRHRPTPRKTTAVRSAPALLSYPIPSARSDHISTPEADHRMKGSGGVWIRIEEVDHGQAGSWLGPPGVHAHIWRWRTDGRERSRLRHDGDGDGRSMDRSVGRTRTARARGRGLARRSALVSVAARRPHTAASPAHRAGRQAEAHMHMHGRVAPGGDPSGSGTDVSKEGEGRPARGQLLHRSSTGPGTAGHRHGATPQLQPGPRYTQFHPSVFYSS